MNLLDPTGLPTTVSGDALKLPGAGTDQAPTAEFAVAIAAAELDGALAAGGGSTAEPLGPIGVGRPAAQVGMAEPQAATAVADPDGAQTSAAQPAGAQVEPSVAVARLAGRPSGPIQHLDRSLAQEQIGAPPSAAALQRSVSVAPGSSTAAPAIASGPELTPTPAPTTGSHVASGAPATSPSHGGSLEPGAAGAASSVARLDRSVRPLSGGRDAQTVALNVQVPRQAVARTSIGHGPAGASPATADNLVDAPTSRIPTTTAAAGATADFPAAPLAPTQTRADPNPHSDRLLPNSTASPKSPPEEIRPDVQPGAAPGLARQRPIVPLGASPRAQLAATTGVIGAESPGFGAPTSAAQTPPNDPALVASTSLPAGRAVVQQITAALPPGTQPGRLEVTLDPPELGRVEISIEVADQSLRATIAADRPITGDLIRRHLDLLHEQFRDAGFADVELSYSGEHGNGPEQRSGEAAPASAGTDAQEAAATTASALDSASAERIDIRL